MKKQIVRIKERSLLARIAAYRLGSVRVAIVVGHTIYLHNTTTGHFLNSPAWLLHELKHVDQYERLGLIGFLWKYLLETIRNGYYNNALEVEARNAEQDTSLLERYQPVPADE